MSATVDSYSLLPVVPHVGGPVPRAASGLSTLYNSIKRAPRRERSMQAHGIRLNVVRKCYVLAHLHG